PSDALLFGTTLAQSLGSVNLPHWKPGTMLTVRLLTQGANGNVVADAIFDPSTGTGVLGRAGTQSITVTGTALSAPGGLENGIAGSAAAVIAISGPARATMVWAEDTLGNANAAFRDTVPLSSTDSTGGMQNFTFSNNDNGVQLHVQSPWLPDPDDRGYDQPFHHRNPDGGRRAEVMNPSITDTGQ